MASATSGISKVTTGTSVRNRRENYYQTQVTTLANGGVKRETYRTDAKGNNQVKISEVSTDKDGNITSDTTLSTASKEERRALQNPNSSLRNSIRQQTKDAGDKAKANSIDNTTNKAIDKAGGGDGNTATDTETGDSQAADPPASTGGGMGGDFVYPKDTIHQSQDVIQFTALEYSAKALETFRFGDRPRVKPGGGGGRSIGTVTLPIQSGIKDQVAAGWGEDTMNPAQMAAAAVALKTITKGGGGFSEATRTGMEQMAKDGDQFAEAVGGIFAEKAAGVQNLLSRTEGKIINPNLELLFKKPTLRQFSLSFKLSARNDGEAQEIVQIIRFFKQNMSPKKGKGSSLFLEAPNTFQVHYLHRGSKEHPYIGRMKECAMTSFEVDYTPDGQYSTYKDGFMTSYMLTMSLKELEPVFSNDYEDIPETEIGF